MRMSKSKVNAFPPPSSSGCASGLVHHTWTVHAVSPLTYYSLRPTYLESMLNEDLCYGGDYCHLTWFTLDQEDEEERGNLKDDDDDDDEFYDESSNRTPGNKRKGQPPRAAGRPSGGSQYRALRTDHEILFGPYANLHLLVELYSNDERLLCSVGLCFVELSRGRIASLGNVALVRGSNPAVEAVWQWMELKTSCRISRSPIRPTSTLIAASVALWTVQSTAIPPGSAKAPQNSKTSNTGLVSLSAFASPYGFSTESVSSPVRPLVLTWTPPPDCQGRGIDTCSTVVAPAGLLRLCHDLRALQIWKDGLSLFVGAGAKMAAANKGSQRQSLSLSTLVSPAKSDPRQPTSHVADPLLATIVNFVSSELGLQLHRFSLSHATCSVACLGSNGQCKPLSDAHMLQCLQVLRSVVQSLHPTTSDAFLHGSIRAKRHLSSSSSAAAAGPSTKKRARQDPLLAQLELPEQRARHHDRNAFGHNGSDTH
jgi:Kinetochore complex Sim4 subunit Fta1